VKKFVFWQFIATVIPLGTLFCIAYTTTDHNAVLAGTYMAAMLTMVVSAIITIETDSSRASILFGIASVNTCIAVLAAILSNTIRGTAITPFTTFIIGCAGGCMLVAGDISIVESKKIDIEKHKVAATSLIQYVVMFLTIYYYL
jgi:hypothetical protein